MGITTEKFDLNELHASATDACRLLKALANPDRLLLLCQLTQGERCVSDMESLLDIRQPTLSQQLSVLREEKLVTTRRDGKQIFYALASKEATAVMAVLYEQFCKPGQGGKK